MITAILVMILLPLIFHLSIKEGIYRGLTFLVISCPCAIAISVPLSYFTGIGVASKKGILIKGSDYLDNLRKLNTIIFDKTGTITTGNFEDLNLIILDNEYSKNDIIKIKTQLLEDLRNYYKNLGNIIEENQLVNFAKGYIYATKVVQKEPELLVAGSTNLNSGEN